MQEIINIILQSRKWGPAREVLEWPSWCRIVPRSGSPQLGGKSLVPEVGLGLLEARGASSGLPWSPLLLFWQECDGRGQREAPLDSPAAPREQQAPCFLSLHHPEAGPWYWLQWLCRVRILPYMYLGCSGNIFLIASCFHFSICNRRSRWLLGGLRERNTSAGQCLHVAGVQ